MSAKWDSINHRLPTRSCTRLVISKIICPLVVVLLAGLSSAQEVDETADTDRKASLAMMRMAADELSVLPPDRDEVQRIESPIYRYHDPARKFVDGSIWCWGQAGRPLALITIARDQRPDRLMVETLALADSPIRLRVGTRVGYPEQAIGELLPMKVVPEVEPPDPTAQRRRSQLKLIARRFKAVEMWDNDGETELQRYELRLLTKPIHQYSDPQNGILSGAIFLFNYGSNPELAMVLEAHQNDWKCGFGRMGWAQAKVTYNGQPFFDQQAFSFRNRDPQYLMMMIPTPKLDSTK